MDRSPLRIAYLLADTPLFGGVKVVLQQANLLARLGHQVSIVSPGEPPAWFPLEAEFLQTPGLEPKDLPDADVTVATYWSTIHRAIEGASGEVAHYCQGFEGCYTHNLAEHPDIERAYRHPVPGIVVSSHLGTLLSERFGRPSRLALQPLEGYWRPRRRWRPSKRPRILVTGPFEIDWKGVETALRAVLEMRRNGLDCELVRLSQWPCSEPERQIVEAEEFHFHLTPSEVPDLVRSCDLLLAPSWEQEGFGLPVLEAMACGVPVVASKIPCFENFARPAAALVPFDDPNAFAASAQEILGSTRNWRAMRKRGFAVAESYREHKASPITEEIMYWIASGEWRAELEAGS